MFLLLHGKDEFMASEELAALRATGGFDLNEDVYVGDEADLAQILATCDTLPFLSERRLVVIEGLPKPKRKRKGADDDADDDDGDDEPAEDDTTAAPVANGKGKSKKARVDTRHNPRAFAQAIADYVPRLPPTTTLVVVVMAPGDERKPAQPSQPVQILVKAAQQHGKVKVCAPLKGAQLEAWLTARARAAGAKLTPEAARLLVEAQGEDRRLLAGEIEKLSVYVGQGGEIRVDDVRLLTPVARQAVIFDLTDALARRDRARALNLLHELLANGESALGIVGMTAFQTRSLLQVKSLAERGMRAPQIAQTAGMAPYVVEKTLPLARQFTFAQLEAAHRNVLNVDLALKRSRMTPELALDLLVIGFGV